MSMDERKTEDSWRSTCTKETLQLRARIMAAVRKFFYDRGVLEVDTPLISTSTVTDPNLDSMKVPFKGRNFYLQTSPEFYMKRLIASGSGDIYQLSHVFREDEQGRFHNPEFLLLEWYRLDYGMHRLIEEVVDLIIYIGKSIGLNAAFPVNCRSYQEWFYAATQISPFCDDVSSFESFAEANGLTIEGSMSSRDWIEWLFASSVQTGFPENAINVVYDFPRNQASLARIDSTNPSVASRFEVFLGNVELANGYHELNDGAEIRDRMQMDLLIRSSRGKSLVPIDEFLIHALDQGFPDCSGVALGVDRLLLKLINQDHLRAVMPFPWDII